MKYIINYITSFFILLFTIASFNWFIDPFAMYWSPQVTHINKIKSEAGKRTRISKAYRVNNIKPQVLIVGNSRVEMGLNPSNMHFAKRMVYNQGMPGAGIAMQIDYALDAIANNEGIEELIVGVDFLDFLLSEKQIASFNPEFRDHHKPNYSFRLSSHNSDKASASFARLQEKMAMIFSLDAFSASLATIFKQQAMVNSIDQHGFNSALSYISIMNTEGIKPLFKQKLHEISTRLTSKRWKIKARETFPYSPTFSHLGRLIRVAKQRNIKLTFFINPYHYSYLHTLADNEQWQNFEIWKQTLVQYLNTIEKSGIALWDFSNTSEFVNESVPIVTPKKQMQWFWEPAHYRESLGNKMLVTLLNQTDNVLTNFGVQLHQNNIKEHLADDFRGLQQSAPQWEKLKQAL